MSDSDRRLVQTVLANIGYYSGRIRPHFRPRNAGRHPPLPIQIKAELTDRLTPDQATKLSIETVTPNGHRGQRWTASQIQSVMIAAFAIGSAQRRFLAREITTDEAKRQVLNEATLIMRAGTAIRSYTQKEIGPLLSEQMTVRFLPHSVPSWSARTVLRAVRRTTRTIPTRRPRSILPIPPTGLPTGKPTSSPNSRRNGDLKEFVTTRDTSSGQFLAFARPFRLTDRGLSRLPFNARRGAADDGRSLRQRQRLRLDTGDVIGAQIVSVPMSSRSRAPTARYWPSSGR